MCAEKDTLRPQPGEPVEITIDGCKMMAPDGGNLLEFMLHEQIPISYFCYHPGLSVVAVCRQCLVGLAGAPKLVPACQTPIRAGMEVDNSSERVLEARGQLLELTLLNHPVDCPICDKAGECTLQRHYMDWDRQTSRMDQPKVHKPKRVAIGPRIMLDDERCILCSRCMRLMADVFGDPQLVIAERGNHSVLTTAPGHHFDSPYSLNTVDICPVGALTDRDFRFKLRVWELSATPSICNGCATGCPLEIHHRQNQIYRLVPRKFKDINLNWMCDFGRYTYKAMAADRLTLPVVKGDKTGWDDALGVAGDKLGKLLQDGQGHRIGVVLGADVTNEDNFVAARLALDFLGTGHLYLAAQPDQEGDAFLRNADPNPNKSGAMACGRGRIRDRGGLIEDLGAARLGALIVVGDLLQLAPEELDRAAALDLLLVQASHPTPLTERAHIVLPAAMWAEVDGTLASAGGKVSRLRAAVVPPSFARPHWQTLLQVARRAGLTLDYPSVRDVFDAMTREIEPLRGAGWGRDVPARLLRYAGSRG